ncbi:zinc-binding dehydrogenase [Catenulispora yoronensis]
MAVENVDKAIAAGTHYASKRYTSQFPVIPGFDGIGVREDGTVVGFATTRLPYGALAERTVAPAEAVGPVPEGIEPEVCAVLAAAVTGMSIKTAAGFQPGETVLVQGATGVAGRLAVKVAKLLGAGRIVATGRDAGALEQLTELGVDTVINTAVSDDELVAAYRKARGDGFDVVVDYLWARPTEILLRTLIPESFSFGRPTRVVQVGESAGSTLSVSADALRTSGVEIYGAAKGLNAEVMGEVYEQIVGWTRAGALTFEVERVPLSEIESAWQRTDLRGKRLVIVP